MKLYVNGCSFTHGHKDFIDSASPDWVWPNVIAENFEEVVNDAWLGGSNQRLVRKTLEFFDKRKDGDDWLAIIQWTDPFSRMELYDDETSTYFGYVPNSPNPVLYYPDNNKFITIPNRLFRMIAIYEKSMLARSKHILKQAFVQQQFLLSEYLKVKKIKFLYTSMSSFGTVHPEYMHPLTKYLPFQNTIASFSSFVNPNTPNLIESETDFHPNKAGHKLLANYIINELKARNYL